MKKLLNACMVVMSLIICQAVSAQDVITLKTGEDLNVKVLKVGNTEVEYKKSDNPDGPSYSVLKNDVFMIKYQNGSKDVFNNSTNAAPATTETDAKKDVETGIKNYQAQQDYDMYMKKFKRRLTGGIVCTAIGVPCLVAGSALMVVGVSAERSDYDLVDTNTDYTAMSVSGAGLAIAGLGLTIAGPIKIGTSFKFKRMAKEAKANLSFVPSVIPANGVTATQTGIAMRLTF